MPLSIPKLNPIYVIALTIYGEARSQSILGQAAVGAVIRNRVNKKNFGSDYRKVCLKPKQFSCWNEGDPNRELLLAIANKLHSSGSYDDKIFNQCMHVARGIYFDIIIDPTKKANHYLTKALYDTLPKTHWSKNMRVTIQIEDHIFLRD